MIIKTVDTVRAGESDRCVPVARWRLALLAISVVASIASGVGAFTFLSATHPALNRVSWSLEPAHRARIVRVAAFDTLQTVNAARGSMRAM